MYAIISQGKVLGFANKIPYVKYKESSKSYSYTDDMDLVVGIAINGQQYAFAGRVPYEGAPEAIVTEVEDSRTLFESLVKARQAEKDIVGHDEALMDVAEASGNNADAIATIEEAVMELAEMITTNE